MVTNVQHLQMCAHDRFRRPAPAGSGYQDGFDVHKLAQTERTQFPAVPRFFHPTEGQRRVGAHEVVHERQARLEFLDREAAPAAAVARENRGAKSVG